jgi:threonylcarbamoyladenosine tRNA methylthiotransferase MtaB
VSFSVEFLGCKISHTDVQGIRERLLAGGLEETGEIGTVHVVNTCCVTNEAVAKSRKAVRAALRRGAEEVFVTGCATRLGDATFADVGGPVTVVRENAEEAAERIARDLGATSCVGPAPRLSERAFVRCRTVAFGCSFCVIRVRGRAVAALRAVLGEARAARPGASRAGRHGCQPRPVSRSDTNAQLPGVLHLAELDGVERAALVDRGQPPERAPVRGACAPPRVPASHVPLQSGDDEC